MTAPVFVTPQALIDEFGEREMVGLTDVGTTQTGAVVVAVAQRVCDRCNAEVAAAVAARYPQALPSVPLVLRYVAQDMAHFYLYASEPPTWVQARFDQARKTLKEVQTGVLPLGLDAAGADAGANAVPQDLPQFVGGAKVFGREAA